MMPNDRDAPTPGVSPRSTSSPTPRRRGRRWGILAIAFALACGAAVWKFRPLNATERTLVGKCRSVGGGAYWIEFRPDRRFETTKVPFVHANDLGRHEWRRLESGIWGASHDVLTLHYTTADSNPSLAGRFTHLVKGLFRTRTESTPLEVEGRDKFYAFDEPFFRQAP